MIPDTDKAYIAGLFDCAGSVHYKKVKRIKHKRPGKPIHNTYEIRMEIAMTDRSTLFWLYEILGCGTLNSRKIKSSGKEQWRWRCSYRDAYYVSCLIWPWSHANLPKIQKIIEHYSVNRDNIVRLEDYKLQKEMENHV